MKRLIILLTCTLLTLSACAPKFNQEEQVVQETDNKNKRRLFQSTTFLTRIIAQFYRFNPERRGDLSLKM